MTSCFTVRTLAQARIAELKKRGQALGAPSMEQEAELRRLEVKLSQIDELLYGRPSSRTIIDVTCAQARASGRRAAVSFPCLDPCPSGAATSTTLSSSSLRTPKYLHKALQPSPVEPNRN
jgi:hypothetical protein